MSNPAFTGVGLKVELGDGASPEVFTEINFVKKGAFSANKVDTTDTTTVQALDRQKTFIATLEDAGEFDFSGVFAPQDATQLKLRNSKDYALHNWQVVLPNSLGTYSFAALTLEVRNQTLELTKDVEFTTKLKISGGVTLA